MRSLCGGVSHVCLCVLDGDAELLSKLFEFLKVLAGAGAGGLVALLEELGAVLGHGVHDFLEVLQLVHCGGWVGGSCVTKAEEGLVVGGGREDGSGVVCWLGEGSL